MEMELSISLVRNLSTKTSRFRLQIALILPGSIQSPSFDTPPSPIILFQQPSLSLPPSLSNTNMAATSAAVLNGLGSPFLSGGKRSQSLLSAGAAAKVGVAAVPASRRLVVAAAAVKKSWLPGVRAGGNLVDPEWLDGS